MNIGLGPDHGNAVAEWNHSLMITSGGVIRTPHDPRQRRGLEFSLAGAHPVALGLQPRDLGGTDSLQTAFRAISE